MLTDFLHRHRAGVLLLLISVFTFLSMGLGLGRTVRGLKTVTWLLASPVVRPPTQIFNQLDAFGGRLFGLVHADVENRTLREQNAVLSQRDLERALLLEENRRLRALLDLRDRYYPEGVAAQVIARDLRAWFQGCTINKGIRDGLTTAAAVVAIGPDQKPALVGRLSEVSEDSSRVVFMTDSLSAVSVSLARSGDIGLAEGRSHARLKLSFLPRLAELKVGDEVMTAGVGGLFPAGIPVGRITEVFDAEGGFFKEAHVEPVLDFGSLREVVILQRIERPLAAKGTS